MKLGAAAPPRRPDRRPGRQLFQAVTQIQEQTLTFIPKILATSPCSLVAGPWMLNQLLSYAQELWLEHPVARRRLAAAPTPRRRPMPDVVLQQFGGPGDHRLLPGARAGHAAVLLRAAVLEASSCRCASARSWRSRWPSGWRRSSPAASTCRPTVDGRGADPQGAARRHGVRVRARRAVRGAQRGRVVPRLPHRLLVRLAGGPGQRHADHVARPALQPARRRRVHRDQRRRLGPRRPGPHLRRRGGHARCRR